MIGLLESNRLFVPQSSESSLSSARLWPLARIAPARRRLFTLALADCDDIAPAPSGDLFLACHSPSEKFTVPVIGQKAETGEMDGYFIRLQKDTHEIVYITRVGGSSCDAASRIAIDTEGGGFSARMAYSGVALQAPAEGQVLP